MRQTAANIVDKFISTSVEVSLIIGILLSDIPRRVIQVSDIGSSNIGMFFDELREIFLQHLLLVLMLRYFGFEIFYGTGDGRFGFLLL